MVHFRNINVYTLVTVTILKVNSQIDDAKPYDRNFQSFIADWVTNKAMDIFYGNSSMVNVMSQSFNGLKDRTVANVLRQGKKYFLFINLTARHWRTI